MKSLEFPLTGTKIPGLTKKFDLNSPAGRKKYFQAKVGKEITTIKKFLKKNTFFAFIVGKKNAGKGTYTKLFSEVFGDDKVVHFSVGDLVRDVSANWKNFAKSPDHSELKKLYRGYISFDEAVKALLGRSTKTLLPTEFVIALVKLRISQHKGKSIFIDGIPRETDQVSYSLYFRDLAGFTDAPDFFILIDIPESVIDARIKTRVICPLCQTSRNPKLLLTSKIDYDEKTKEFSLICDNPSCPGAKMLPKEGDEFGIEPIKHRLIKDGEIIKQIFAIHGIPKILMRNHVPVKKSKKYFDDYELTPEYVLSWDKSKKKVMVEEKPWTVKDDSGVESYSLLAPPVLVTMIKQLAKLL